MLKFLRVGLTRAGTHLTSLRVPMQMRSLWRQTRAWLWRACRHRHVVGLGVTLLTMTAVVVAYRYMTHASHFAVHHFVIKGHDRLSREEILTLTGLAYGDNIFSADIDRSRHHLLAHPWVQEAHIERMLPDTYAINLNEYQAIAVLDSGGAQSPSYLVSATGVVFKQYEQDALLDLPTIRRVDGRQLRLDHDVEVGWLGRAAELLRYYRQSRVYRYARLQELHYDADQGFTLLFSPTGMHVHLGDQHFKDKLVKLGRILQHLDRRGKKPAYVYLNSVRRPNRAVVGMRDH